MLAEGVGTLEYANADIFNASIAELPALDRVRLQRPWAKDACQPLYGSTPAIRNIANIVDEACVLNTSAGGARE
jgi:hypothetical protein